MRTRVGRYDVSVKWGQWVPWLRTNSTWGVAALGSIAVWWFLHR